MLENFPFKSKIRSIVLIYFGTLLVSLGINLFIINAKLVSGGLSGIALIIQYLYGLSAGYTVLVLNIPLLIFSFVFVDKKFTIYTIIGICFLSINLILTDSCTGFLSIDDSLLLSIYGGFFTGLGNGIVFANHGCTGGIDILAAFIKKKRENASIGTISLFQNTIIVFIGALFFGVSSALLSLISMFISSTMADKTIRGFGKRRLALIITDKDEEVCDAIMNDIKRGVTLLHGEGAYTHKKRNVIYCALALSEVPRVKHIIKSCDPYAFISILDANEIEGRGFNKSFIG